MPLRIEPVVLEGRTVRLEPLCAEHAQGLYNRGRVQADWAYLPRGCFVDQADTRHWIEEALTTPGHLPFAIVDANNDKVVGSTRYLTIRPEHRSLEIGWTWLGQEWQRTAVNTEVKLLLLTHAFEQLGCVRVEFKTDARNERSQRALLRIGAKREGVMRNHMIVQNNYLRDSVYFSVIDAEWPNVKALLESLATHATPATPTTTATPAPTAGRKRTK
jgi:RimJ/RimL family protein N-acetyltransferase